MIRVGGLPLRTSRSGEGPPLLLINGLGAGIEMWNPFVRRIRDREVITFDLPGAGRSGHARWPLRMNQLAELVRDLLDRLDRERVDLLGYSLGGMLAQEVARRFPDRVGRLVLAATSPGVPSVPPNPLAALLMLTPARYYDRRIAEMIVPLIAGGRTSRERNVMRRGVDLRLADPPTITGYLHQLYSVCAWSSHSWLGQLRQPTLVLHGDEDPLVPLINARYLAWVIRGGQLHVMPGAGHLFLLDQPDDSIAAIESFFSTTTYHAGGKSADLS